MLTKLFKLEYDNIETFIELLNIWESIINTKENNRNIIDLFYNGNTTQKQHFQYIVIHSLVYVLQQANWFYRHKILIIERSIFSSR